MSGEGGTGGGSAVLCEKVIRGGANPFCFRDCEPLGSLESKGFRATGADDGTDPKDSVSGGGTGTEAVPEEVLVPTMLPLLILFVLAFAFAPNAPLALDNCCGCIDPPLTLRFGFAPTAPLNSCCGCIDPPLRLARGSALELLNPPFGGGASFPLVTSLLVQSLAKVSFNSLSNKEFNRKSCSSCVFFSSSS